MSERDLKRIEVLTEVLAGRRTVVSAAAVLALGVRQTFRLLARYQDGGGGASPSRRCTVVQAAYMTSAAIDLRQIPL